MDNSTYGMLLALIKKTLAGGGAIKGKNCTIQSISDIEGGHRVTFKWTLDDGTVQTNYMVVMDGVQGEKGDKGDRGAIGPSGAQGIQGVQGPAGPKGDTGAQGIQGIQGEQGIQGIQGPKGDDGYPFLIYKQYNDISEFDASEFPEIGLMFMVMTWETDPETGDALGYPIYRFTDEGEPPYTLVTHMNTQGIQGPKGDKGDTGAQGPKGDTGEQGAKGDKGDKGDTGAQGIQGEQGIGLPDGGLTGQVLAKYSNQDYDFDWMSTTDTVRPDSTALVQSRAVYSAINNALSSIYTPRGELTCEELTSDLLIEANVGYVYEMSDAGETTALFLNGAGKVINIGDNVGIIKAGANTYLFNLMANAFDMHDFQKKNLVSPVESQTSVESALQALSGNKISKVNNSTNGDIALLDASGNIIDSSVNIEDLGRGMSKYVKAGIASAGWYKIFEGGGYNQGESIRIDLGSFFNNNANSSHVIDIAFGYEASQMSETCRDQHSIFTKMRICYGSGNTKNTILVYYNKDQSNSAYANILSTQYSNNGEAFAFTAVDETQYDHYIEFNLGNSGLYTNGKKVVTNDIVPDYAGISNKLVAASDLNSYVVSNEDLTWTDTDIKTAVARICGKIETETLFTRTAVETKPMFIKDIHAGNGAGMCVVCGNGTNYLYGLYFTYYTSAVYHFYAARVDNAEVVTMIKISGSVV